jgi:hypothetical protein
MTFLLTGTPQGEAESIEKGYVFVAPVEAYMLQAVIGQFVVSVLEKKISHVEVPDHG